MSPNKSDSQTDANSDRTHLHRYALRVEYDGSKFSGFQRQAPGVPTVQGALEEAIRVFAREDVNVSCCGRTDAGVHATGQIAGIALSKPVSEIRRFVYGVNGMLPDAVSIQRCIPVPVDFHPRFSCVAREYEYLIWNGPHRPVHWREHSLWLRDRLDLEMLNERFAEIVGYHDYAAFTRAEHKDEGTVRFLKRIDFRYVPDPLSGSDRELVAFRVLGNAFLHNMIRILVGTALDLTQKKLSLDLPGILASRDRKLAGRTAPAQGLYFREAYYRSIPGVEGLSYLDDFPDFRQALREARGDALTAPPRPPV
ncbi:MAG: tRNA pseudouridine(38-40) synthase TruA [bacterium]|nr:tRNA pseudouridine(38-40) synthase TruA [bacterium]